VAGRDEIADVLTDDGVITAIGSGLGAPADAQIIDATGMVVTPGLIDPRRRLRIRRGELRPPIR
jgi:dihydroorotase